MECHRCACASRDREGRHVSAYFDPNRWFGACPQGGAPWVVARQINGAKVTALTVKGSFNVYDVPASKVHEMSGSFAEQVQRTKAHAEKILNGVAEAARLAGVACETVASRTGSSLRSHHRHRPAERLRSHRHGLARQERDCGNRAWQCDDQGASRRYHRKGK